MYSSLKLFGTLDIENPQESLPTLSQWFTISVSKKIIKSHNDKLPQVMGYCSKSKKSASIVHRDRS